jgi:hypothetical protein
MLVLWGLSLIPPIESWGNPNEDGFSYVPAFWANTAISGNRDGSQSQKGTQHGL